MAHLWKAKAEQLRDMGMAAIVMYPVDWAAQATVGQRMLRVAEDLGVHPGEVLTLEEGRMYAHPLIALDYAKAIKLDVEFFEPNPKPTTPTLPSKFVIGDKPVATNVDGLVSLTDLHKASGKSVHHRPTIWLRQSEAVEFSAALAEKLNVPVDHIYQSKRGVGGGTFAHWQIALAYAKYLSPELHMAVNEVFMRYKTGDPTLAEEVIDCFSI